jgi:lysophospholipase L1-like esterase
VAFTHFNSGGFIDRETYSITYKYYNLHENKYLVDKLQNRLNDVDGNGKYEYSKMFSAVTNYSVVENRYITINGVQGNKDWCNLYSFTTEVNRIYAIYGTASNVYLPLAYYQENGIVNQYDGKLVFVVGDGTTIYINSKSDTLLIYEFIMNGSSADVANPHEVEILQQYDNIVCCGDSLTYGAVYYRSEVKQALNPYPKVLGKLTGCNVANIASGGYSAKNWWDNYNAEITGENKLYIIYLGVNGQLTDTVDTDCVGNDYTTYANTNTGCYGKIIQKILDNGSQVILIGIEQMLSSSTYTDTIKAVNSLATRFGVPKVDSPAKYLYADAYHRAPGSSDINSVHLNNLGYAKFASILVHEISNLSPEEQYKLQPVQ